MITEDTMIASDKRWMLELVEQLVHGGTFHKHHGFVELGDKCKQEYIKILKEHFGFSDKSIELLSK